MPPRRVSTGAVVDDDRSTRRVSLDTLCTVVVSLLLLLMFAVVNHVIHAEKSCVEKHNRMVAEYLEHMEKYGEWLTDHLEFSAMFPKHSLMILEADGEIGLRVCVTGEGIVRIGGQLQLCGQRRRDKFESVPLYLHYNITFTGECIKVITDGKASVWTNADANDLCITAEPPKCVPSE